MADTNEKGLVSRTTVESLKATIQSKSGTSGKMTFAQMEEAVASISGGGVTPTGTIQITENGTFDVTQYASAAVNVSGGGGGTGDGWELINEFTASEDVATINIEIPSAKRGMNVYKVQLTGETSASEWIYFNVNSTGAQANGSYFPKHSQYDVSFFASKRGLDSGGYSIISVGNSVNVLTSETIKNIFLNLYNSSSRFKNGFNVKLYGIN